MPRDRAQVHEPKSHGSSWWAQFRVLIRVPHLHVQSASRWVITLALLLTPALPTHAQGCAQCLDSTRATPPAVQAAYRHAIYLLGGAASTLFIAGTLLLSRNR